MTLAGVITCTRMATVVDAPGDLATLIPSWALSLRAARKAPSTLRLYTDAAYQFHAYLLTRGMPTIVANIRREHVEAFLADMAERVSPSSVATRYRGLKQLCRWLLEEGEITTSPMVNIRPPALDERPVRVLSKDELRKLIAACAGTSFDDRRDLAILRVFIDTGARRSEVAGLTIDDVDLTSQTLRLTGKGDRMRIPHIGTTTARDLDRYLRLRARHKDAHLPWLWLGQRGRLTDSGIVKLARYRGAQAGIEGLHLHVFRHTAAHHWLMDGGTEIDLMRNLGWKSRDMLTRYGASAADERARSAHERLGLGDRL